MREISRDGEVARLQSVDGSALEVACFAAESSSLPVSSESIELFIESLRATVDTLHADALADFITKATSRADDCPPNLVAVCCPSKESRTEVHKAVKANFSVGHIRMTFKMLSLYI